MTAHSSDRFGPDGGWGSRLRNLLPFVIVALVLLAFAWFVYDQLTAVRGVRVEAPSAQLVDMLPPPPPPPPTPPEPEETPPEPTEQPEPAPSEAPEPQQQQQAAPVTIAGEAQAGTDSFGLAAGDGGGIGNAGSSGTCLGTSCGPSRGGGGMGETVYRRYLSTALQERVQEDEKLSRLIFTADLHLTVTPDGRITGVELVDATGRNEKELGAQLLAVLAGVRGLDPPPASMSFPQRITVRGKKRGF